MAATTLEDRNHFIPTGHIQLVNRMFAVSGPLPRQVTGAAAPLPVSMLPAARGCGKMCAMKIKLCRTSSGGSETIKILIWYCLLFPPARHFKNSFSSTARATCGWALTFCNCAYLHTCSLYSVALFDWRERLPSLSQVHFYLFAPFLRSAWSLGAAPCMGCVSIPLLVEMWRRHGRA